MGPSTALLSLPRGGCILVHVALASMRHVRLHAGIAISSCPAASHLATLSPNLLLLASTHGNTLLVRMRRSGGK